MADSCNTSKFIISAINGISLLLSFRFQREYKAPCAYELSMPQLVHSLTSLMLERLPFVFKETSLEQK